MLKDYRVVFTKPEEAALIGKEFDETVAEGEIWGENVLSLISTGSERGGFTSHYDPSNYPMQTGYCSIARVKGTGKGVTRFKEGDLFYHSGYHTRFVKVKEEEAIGLPENCVPEKVLFGRFAAVSMTSMFHSVSKPVDQVVVTGLGMVGLMGAQMLQNFGYRVYGIDPSPERRAIAERVGVCHVAESIESWPELRGKAAVLYECSGNEQAMHAVIPYMKKGGELFQIGVPWKKTSEWDAHTLLNEIFYGFLSLHGGWEWSIPRKDDDFHSHSNESHIKTAMELIAEDKVKVIEEMYELRSPKECAQVYAEIMIPRMKPTSVMFDWRNFKED